jgi:transposase
VTNFSEEELVRAHTWFLEKMRRRMRESEERLKRPVTQLVLIMDMTGIGLIARKTISSFRVTSHIDQNYYPEVRASKFTD